MKIINPLPGFYTGIAKKGLKASATSSRYKKEKPDF